jgi:hypothetical protein
VLEADDTARVAERAAALEQGDIISTTHFASLGAPESTFHPDTEALDFCPGQNSDVWAAPARPIRSGWGVLVTQTCDLVEPPDREPYMQVAPLLVLDDEGLWRRAQDGRDHRIFSLPSVAGINWPAIEPQVSFPVEKASLLHPGVRTESVALEPAQRIHLSLWLARRCGRHAFPDTTEDLVLRPLRRELGKRYEQDSQAGAFARSLLGIWATAAETATIDVCFVLNPSLLRAHLDQLGPDSSAYDGYCEQLLRSSARKIQNTGSALQVRSFARTLDRIDAHRLLFEMRQVDMDLLPANFFEAEEEAEAPAEG